MGWCSKTRRRRAATRRKSSVHRRPPAPSCNTRGVSSTRDDPVSAGLTTQSQPVSRSHKPSQPVSQAGLSQSHEPVSAGLNKPVSRTGLRFEKRCDSDVSRLDEMGALTFSLPRCNSGATPVQPRFRCLVPDATRPRVQRGPVQQRPGATAARCNPVWKRSLSVETGPDAAPARCGPASARCNPARRN